MDDQRVENPIRKIKKSKSWRHLGVDNVVPPRRQTGYTPPKSTLSESGRAVAVRRALLRKNNLNQRAKTTDSFAPPKSTSSMPIKRKPHLKQQRPATAIGTRTSSTSTTSTTTAVWNMKSVLFRQPGNSSILTASRRVDPLLRIMARKEEQREDLSDSLLVAAENGDAKTVDALLRQGASADARGSKGLEQFTALHYAACRGHLFVAERLIRAGGATVDATNKDAETPLHLAVYGGFLNIVELLLDSGANVHAQNGYSETPLFYAARQGYGALTRLLMRRGANPDHKSRFGDTATDDCSDHRVKLIIEQWHVHGSTSNTSSSGNGGECGLVGFSTGLLGKLPTRVLEHICGLLDVKGLGTIAQIDGRCHRVVESKSLWDALGVSRWELAVRASVKKAAGGFEMVPMLANYRPSGTTSRPTSRSSENRAGTSTSRPTSKDGEREGSAAAVVLTNDGAVPQALIDTTQAKKEGNNGTATVPVASGFGFSMDIFLD